MDWKLNIQNSGWALILAWFGANLLSQALYMGKFGQPYDAQAMLLSLGTWYWVLLAAELVVWTVLGALLFSRFKERFQAQKPTPEAA